MAARDARAGRDSPSGVVVVSGAASGIGRALALRFARERARLALLDRDAEGVESLAAQLRERGAEALGLRCDVASFEQCQAALHGVEERFGGVDVLVNNAGITHRSPFLETDVAVFRRVMDVNFFGALQLTKAAQDALLRRRGLVVVISSVAGFSPLLGRSGYCASKHALHGLFDTLRCELAPKGVRVLLVCPGFTRTRIETDALGGRGEPATHPQSRVGAVARPEEVADAVVRAVRSGRSLLVLSTVGRLARLLTRVSPGLYARAMSRSLRQELEREPPASGG